MSEIYRVRESFKNIKSQKGAYFLLDLAIKSAKRYGLKVFDSNGNLLFNGYRGQRVLPSWIILSFEAFRKRLR